MPRRPRIELAGGVHHVTARTPSGRRFFHSDLDCRRYLRLLEAEVEARRWSVFSYCLMTNHLHVLVRTPHPDLGAGFKRIHEGFAGAANRRRDEHGHLFGDRFYSGLVRDDRHLLACLRYIARNPVEAAICERAEDWPWSAHRALIGLTVAPSFLDVAGVFELMAADEKAARIDYARLTTQPNATLLATLARAGSDGWLATAVDQFGIPVKDVAHFLRVSLPTAYRQVAAAREKKGTDP